MLKGNRYTEGRGDLGRHRRHQPISEKDLADRRLKSAGNNVHQSRFAGPVFAEDRVNFARINTRTDVPVNRREFIDLPIVGSYPQEIITVNEDGVRGFAVADLGQSQSDRFFSLDRAAGRRFRLDELGVRAGNRRGDDLRSQRRPADLCIGREPRAQPVSLLARDENPQSRRGWNHGQRGARHRGVIKALEIGQHG